MCANSRGRKPVQINDRPTGVVAVHNYRHIQWLPAARERWLALNTSIPSYRLRLDVQIQVNGGRQAPVSLSLTVTCKVLKTLDRHDTVTSKMVILKGEPPYFLSVGFIWLTKTRLSRAAEYVVVTNQIPAVISKFKGRKPIPPCLL